MSQADCIEARLSLLATSDGGRKAGIRDGYRSGVLVFPEWDDTWQDKRGRHVCIGARVRLLDTDQLDPGQTGTVRFYFWAPEGLGEVDLSRDVTFRLWEGRFIGQGTALKSLVEPWPG